MIDKDSASREESQIYLGFPEAQDLKDFKVLKVVRVFKEALFRRRCSPFLRGICEYGELLIPL